MKKKESPLYHLTRDTLALGGLAFFAIVTARATIAPYYTFVYQLLTALAILTVLSFKIENSNNNIARALILVVFSIMFYNVTNFTILSSLLFVGIIASAIYQKSTTKQIIAGLLLGTISTTASYFLINLL